MFLTIIALLLLIIGIGFALKGTVDDGREVIHLRLPGVIITVVGVLVLLFACVNIVGPGEYGVPVSFGKAGAPLASGIHFNAPWVNVHTVSTRSTPYVMVAKATEGDTGDDSVTITGADQGTGKLDARLLWHVEGKDASDVYRRFGGDVEKKVVRPTAHNCLTDAASRYTLVDARTNKRAEYEDRASACIEKVFVKDGIHLDQLQVSNIELPAGVQDSVNDQVASANRLNTARNTADAKRIDAQATSDAQKIITCGGKQGTDPVTGKPTIVPKEGGECANNLTPALLDYYYIQAIDKNASSANHTVIVTPSPDGLLSQLQASQGAP